MTIFIVKMIEGMSFAILKIIQSLKISEKDVTSEPSVSDWVIQIPLWPSGLGVGLSNRRPRIDPRTVRYSGGSGNRVHVSGNSLPWLKVA